MDLDELRRDWREPAAILAAVTAVAGLGSWATCPPCAAAGTAGWTPRPGSRPARVRPVWSVLYALLATSVIACRRRASAGQRRSLDVLFGSNLALNLASTLIFFRGRSPLAAGVEIVALEGTCVALVVRAWPLSRLAARALVPYALWVAFATALTWSIAVRNR